MFQLKMHSSLLIVHNDLLHTNDVKIDGAESWLCFIFLLSLEGIWVTLRNASTVNIPCGALTLLLGAFLWWGLWGLGSWNVFIFLIWAIALRRTLKAPHSTTLLSEPSWTGFGLFILTVLHLPKLVLTCSAQKQTWPRRLRCLWHFLNLKEQRQKINK